MQMNGKARPPISGYEKLESKNATRLPKTDVVKCPRVLYRSHDRDCACVCVACHADTFIQDTFEGELRFLVPTAVASDPSVPRQFSGSSQMLQNAKSRATKSLSRIKSRLTISRAPLGGDAALGASLWTGGCPQKVLGVTSVTPPPPPPTPLGGDRDRRDLGILCGRGVVGKKIDFHRFLHSFSSKTLKSFHIHITLFHRVFYDLLVFLRCTL